MQAWEMNQKPTRKFKSCQVLAMMISFLSFLGILLFLKLSNDCMMYYIFRSIEKDPRSYRNTYKLPQKVFPLSDQNYD